jgi:Branched-chain amino acid ABC-type transport system, permease components
MLVSVLNGFAIGFLLFILAVGLSLVFGMMDVLNLAHGALFVSGAYLGASFAGGGWGGFLAALALAAVAGLAAGGVLSLMTEPLRRRSHLDQALLTLGVALVVAEVLIILFGDDPLSVPAPPGLDGSVSVLGAVYPAYRLVLIVVGAVLALAVYLVGGPDARGPPWSAPPSPTARWSPRSASTTGWSRPRCSGSARCSPPRRACSAARSTAPGPGWTPRC